MSGMRGWRIEVVEGFDAHAHDGGTTLDVVRRNGEHVRLRLHAFQLTPAPARAIRTFTQAAVDPLFETIYVSRPLTDAEADTLRTLLDAELQRERETRRSETRVEAHTAEGGSMDWRTWSPRKLPEIEGTFVATVRPTFYGNAKIKSDDAPVYYSHINGWLDWVCPKCRVMHYELRSAPHSHCLSCGFELAETRPEA